MYKHYILYFISLVVLVGMSSCKPTKTICTYYPQYKIHADSIRVNDQIVSENVSNVSLNDGLIEYFDDDIKILFLMDTTISDNSGYILCLTNLKGSLLYLKNSDITINGEFAFDKEEKSPYIPKYETYCLPLFDNLLIQKGSFYLKSKMDLGFDYDQASKDFNNKVDDLKESKPDSFSSYVTFLVHFYDNTVKYYTIYLTYEGLNYKISFSKEKYNYYFPPF